MKNIILIAVITALSVTTTQAFDTDFGGANKRPRQQTRVVSAEEDIRNFNTIWNRALTIFARDNDLPILSDTFLDLNSRTQTLINNGHVDAATKLLYTLDVDYIGALKYVSPEQEYESQLARMGTTAYSRIFATPSIETNVVEGTHDNEDANLETYGQFLNDYVDDALLNEAFTSPDGDDRELTERRFWFHMALTYIDHATGTDSMSAVLYLEYAQTLLRFGDIADAVTKAHTAKDYLEDMLAGYDGEHDERIFDEDTINEKIAACDAILNAHDPQGN